MTTETRHAYVESALGELLLVAQDDGLSGLYFPQHRYPPRADGIGHRVEEGQDGVLDHAAAELRGYLAGSLRTFTVPVLTAGDAFSEQVWALLREIPYGATTNYGALAARLGNPHLAQRVGQAVGHNPVSIVIPCHRVVGADGSLTGYAGGLERKRLLLALEEPPDADADRLF